MPHGFHGVQGEKRARNVEIVSELSDQDKRIGDGGASEIEGRGSGGVVLEPSHEVESFAVHIGYPARKEEGKRLLGPGALSDLGKRARDRGIEAGGTQKTKATLRIKARGTVG